jgi:hypothetical protein
LVHLLTRQALASANRAALLSLNRLSQLWSVKLPRLRKVKSKLDYFRTLHPEAVFKCCRINVQRVAFNRMTLIKKDRRCHRRGKGMHPPEETITAATLRYERWVRKRVDVVEADLQLKHKEMASSLFAFLRATFYRWASLWPAVCPDLGEAPRVRAVGDLHVENFSTWRDTEGRLVWGVNDFASNKVIPVFAELP